MHFFFEIYRLSNFCANYKFLSYINYYNILFYPPTGVMGLIVDGSFGDELPFEHFLSYILL